MVQSEDEDEVGSPQLDPSTVYKCIDISPMSTQLPTCSKKEQTRTLLPSVYKLNINDFRAYFTLNWSLYLVLISGAENPTLMGENESEDWQFT